MQTLLTSDERDYLHGHVAVVVVFFCSFLDVDESIYSSLETNYLFSAGPFGRVKS